MIFVKQLDFSISASEEELYFGRLLQALRTARFNKLYPPRHLLGNYIQAMSPICHQQYYPAIELDLESGMPRPSQWQRVYDDFKRASGERQSKIPSKRDRKLLEKYAEQNPYGQRARELQLLNYEAKLRELNVIPTELIHVALRRQHASRGEAEFYITVDGLDSRGFAIRFSIELTMSAEVWRDENVDSNRADAKGTQEFREYIHRILRQEIQDFIELDGISAFEKLDMFEGLRLQQLHRAVVGPMYFEGMEFSPAPTRELIADDFIASFGLQRIRRNQLLRQHHGESNKTNDPFIATLPEEISSDLEIFYDRKFATTKHSRLWLEPWIESSGMGNLIYAMPEGV